MPEPAGDAVAAVRERFTAEWNAHAAAARAFTAFCDEWFSLTPDAAVYMMQAESAHTAWTALCNLRPGLRWMQDGPGTFHRHEDPCPVCDLDAGRRDIAGSGVIPVRSHENVRHVAGDGGETDAR